MQKGMNTGFLDKNGKVVFSGDKVKIDLDEFLGRTFKVDYLSEFLAFVFTDNCSMRFYTVDDLHEKTNEGVSQIIEILN